jgi:hypothetical protein
LRIVAGRSVDVEVVVAVAVAEVAEAVAVVEEAFEEAAVVVVDSEIRRRFLEEVLYC